MVSAANSPSPSPSLVLEEFLVVERRICYQEAKDAGVWWVEDGRWAELARVTVGVVVWVQAAQGGAV